MSTANQEINCRWYDSWHVDPLTVSTHPLQKGARHVQSLLEEEGCSPDQYYKINIIIDIVDLPKPFYETFKTDILETRSILEVLDLYEQKLKDRIVDPVMDNKPPIVTPEDVDILF